MILSKKDLPILVISFIIIFTASLLLYLDFTAKVSHGDEERIGTIRFKKRIAKRKYTGQVIWEELDQDSPLYNLDSIQTDKNSLSIIRLKDGSEIELDENTLIVLNWSKEGIMINFSQGSISARKKDDTESRIKITTGNTSVDIGKGNVNLFKKDDKSLSLNVSSGTARISTQEGTREVTKNETAVVTKEKLEVKKIHIFPLRPLPDRYYVTTKGSQDIAFTWKSEEKIKSVLEVSADRAFTEIKSKNISDNETHTMAITPGTYYWRISSQKGEGISEVRKFTILKDEQAVPLIPSRGSEYTFASSNPMITFKWSKSTYAESYKLEISRDPAMKEITKVLKSSQNSISTNELTEGTYFWRIKQGYSFEGVKDITAVSMGKFIIAKQKSIPSPALITPPENEKFSSLLLANEGLVFNWSQNDDIAEYNLIISKDKQNKQVILRGKTGYNYYTLEKRLKPGTYYWQVSARAGRGDIIPAKWQRKFSVSSVEKLATRSPSQGSTLSSLELKKGIRFSWVDPNLGKSYFFEVARDRDFKKMMLSQYSKSSSVSIKKLPEGTLFWRVSLVDKNRKPIVKSNTASLSVASMLKEPVAVYPKNKKIVDITRKNTLTFSWKKIQNATLYHFKVYQYKGGIEKPIYEARSKKTSINFNDFKLFDKGNFYWEVQAFQYRGDRIISQSNAKKFYFTITLKEPTKEPELITPDIIYVK